MALQHAEGGWRGCHEWQLWLVSDNGRCSFRPQIRPISPCETGAGRGSSASGSTWRGWGRSKIGVWAGLVLCHGGEGGLFLESARMRDYSVSKLA